MSEQAKGYKQYLVSNFALKDLATFVVWTTASFANQVFGHHDLPTYNNGQCIIMCPDKREWEILLSSTFAPYGLPEPLTMYYQSLPDYQMTQIFFHEMTHDSDLFGSDYGEARDDYMVRRGEV